MIDLKQEKLKEWQETNFPRERYEALTKDQLIDIILVMQFTLGMAEEVGEVCHHILKGVQGIRGGVDGFNKKEIADGVADSLVFGQQLLSRLELDAEAEIKEVIYKVLQRNWKKDPTGGNIGEPIQESKYCECSQKGLICRTHIGPVSGAVICNHCGFPVHWERLYGKPTFHHPV